MGPHFHHKLDDLKHLLLQMGGLVEDQLRRAVDSLFESDRAKARHAIALDEDVDRLELQVDEACVQLLALYQPAATDLRLVAAAMKVVTELERIGDQAVNLARCTLEPEVPAALLEGGLRRMAALARDMVSDSLDALARGDVELARRVVATDDAVDALEHETVRSLLAHAAREPESLRSVFRLAFAARCLERVADHATNVAEMALYVEEGVIERHGVNSANPPEPRRTARFPASR